MKEVMFHSLIWGFTLGDFPSVHLMGADVDADLDDLNLLQSKVGAHDTSNSDAPPPEKCKSAGAQPKTIGVVFSSPFFYEKGKKSGVYPVGVTTNGVGQVGAMQESDCQKYVAQWPDTGVVYEWDYMKGFNGWSDDITSGQCAVFIPGKNTEPTTGCECMRAMNSGIVRVGHPYRNEPQAEWFCNADNTVNELHLSGGDPVSEYMEKWGWIGKRDSSKFFKMTPQKGFCRNEAANAIGMGGACKSITWGFTECLRNCGGRGGIAVDYETYSSVCICYFPGTTVPMGDCPFLDTHNQKQVIDGQGFKSGGQNCPDCKGPFTGTDGYAKCLCSRNTTFQVESYNMSTPNPKYVFNPRGALSARGYLTPENMQRRWCWSEGFPKPTTTTTTTTTEAPAPAPAPAPSSGGQIEDGKCHGTEDISDGTDEYDSPCFDADSGFGPDFRCDNTEMWCGHDSGDGLVVGQCCPKRCRKECENKNKKKNEEARKKAERERKEKRKANEESRKNAEKERKKKRKDDEWRKKREAKKEKNEKAEDERKDKRKWDEKKKKKERAWKKDRENRKKNADKRERARKQERGKKEKRTKGAANNAQGEKAKKEKRKKKKQNSGGREKSKKEKRKKKQASKKRRKPRKQR